MAPTAVGVGLSLPTVVINIRREIAGTPNPFPNTAIPAIRPVVPHGHQEASPAQPWGLLRMAVATNTVPIEKEAETLSNKPIKRNQISF
jgi:hypothetical protein